MEERFESIGWALFVILVGVNMFSPEGFLPNGGMSTGIGAILAIYWIGGKVSGYSVSYFLLFLALAFAGNGALTLIGASETFSAGWYVVAIGITWLVSLIFPSNSKKSDK
jgi:hypothetical protein